jgi:hypothetical protein
MFDKFKSGRKRTMKLLVTMSQQIAVVTGERVTISHTLFIEEIKQGESAERKDYPLGMYLGATKVKVLGFEPSKPFGAEDIRIMWIGPNHVIAAEVISE